MIIAKLTGRTNKGKSDVQGSRNGLIQMTRAVTNFSKVIAVAFLMAKYTGKDIERRCGVMARYIDADKLYHIIKAKTNPYGKPSLDYESGVKVLDMIKRIPAADVVEAVRCKDCVYWQDNNDGYPHKECRWGKDETPDAYDFCSYGERKTI